MAPGQHVTNQSVPWRPPTNSRSELRPGAGNLIADHYQQNNLTFSGHNLGMDSRRRVHGNVNMIDHIKEQNMVEISKQEQAHDAHIQTNPTKPVSVNDDQPERILDGKSKQPELISDDQQQVDIKDEKNRRRLRLDRTCQNQSFHLGQNDYPDIKHPVDGTRFGYDETSAGLRGVYNHSGGKSKNYTNLFRESPQFTGTTARYQEDERDTAEATSLLSHQSVASTVNETEPLTTTTKPDQDPVEVQSEPESTKTIPLKKELLAAGYRNPRSENEFQCMGSRSSRSNQ